jgi:predicted nuclease of predicted toxin-antitoxin system
MKILIDMNLSPDWVEEFKLHRIEAIHWSNVGIFDAPDKNIIDWAKKHNYVIFTHDLDFGTALALTKAEKPSVVQVRTQNVTIFYLSKIVLPAIKTHADLLEKGALLVIDEDKKRIRILPV